MFTIDRDFNMTLTRGDTLAVRFTMKGTDDAPLVFSPDDRVIFTLKKQAAATAQVILEHVLTPEATEQPGAYTVPVGFSNEQTRALDALEFKWDLRVVFSPQYDETGRIVGGECVTTPFTPKRLKIVEAVGNV